MAARKTTKALPPAWREKIQTTVLLKRLTQYVNDEIKLEPAQVTAALGLLKKSLPDLSATSLSNPDGTALKFEATVNFIKPNA